MHILSLRNDFLIQRYNSNIHSQNVYAIVVTINPTITLWGVKDKSRCQIWEEWKTGFSLQGT